ncbi:hypothetical protein CCP3SC15_140038 [Gammaproteobacteria bacterium]
MATIPIARLTAMVCHSNNSDNAFSYAVDHAKWKLWEEITACSCKIAWLKVR